MASVDDIASWGITESGASGSIAAATLDITAVLETEVDIETMVVPGDVATIEVVTPGMQGPPGTQNVFVQDTPPDNPEVNWIWIDTS